MFSGKLSAWFEIVGVTHSHWTRRDVPTIAAEMIGSVGVRQAATTIEEMKLRLGKTTKITATGQRASRLACTREDGLCDTPATTNQPNAMVGTTMTRRPLACLAR